MALVVLSCGSSSVAPQLCPADVDVLSTITDVDGTQYKISVDGNVYKVVGNSCELFLRYFEPNFEANGYEHRGDSVFLRSDQGPFPARNNFIDDFERYGAYPDLFIQSMVDTDRFWNTMILQGPQSPSIADYVALRACILRGTCTFRDNRIDIATDPLNPLNKVMKFTAVAPSASMVTSKVHFAFDDQMGRVELWQDGAKILDVNAPTLPLVNAIQTIIEVGISAASKTDLSRLAGADRTTIYIKCLSASDVYASPPMMR